MPRYLDRDRDVSSRASADYQLELGTGSVIGLLCALAVLCGLFFAFGYTLGRHTVPAAFSLGDANNAAAPVNGSQLPVEKPNPSTLAPAPSPTTQGGAQPPNAADLSAAESNQTPATLQPAPAGGAATVPAPSAAPVPAPAAPRQPVTTNSAPSTASTQPSVTAGGGYAVQVFAGNNSADAVNLAAALKARQYPVFVVRPVPGGADALYRVQVGPYATEQEAEEMRARLAADGYNAIIKH